MARALLSGRVECGTSRAWLRALNASRAFPRGSFVAAHELRPGLAPEVHAAGRAKGGVSPGSRGSPIGRPVGEPSVERLSTQRSMWPSGFAVPSSRLVSCVDGRALLSGRGECGGRASLAWLRETNAGQPSHGRFQLSIQTCCRSSRHRGHACAGRRYGVVSCRLRASAGRGYCVVSCRLRASADHAYCVVSCRLLAGEGLRGAYPMSRVPRQPGNSLRRGLTRGRWSLLGA